MRHKSHKMKVRGEHGTSGSNQKKMPPELLVASTIVSIKEYHK